MEGTLLKWTNYFNGWQPRYFILEDGVLSYYYSQDDINNSCKGSIKVAACDINAHSSDPTRLDIVVPGEAHYHLKAATPHDRQLWLVVLGTCKACNNNAGFLIGNQAKNDAEISSHDKLKLKKSELLTYYDILTQHTYNIKMAIKDKTNPDIQLLNESTTLIGETCESFVKSLDECLRLVETRNHSSSSFSSFQSSPTTFKNSSWGSQPLPRHSASIDRKSLSRGASKEKEHFPMSSAAAAAVNSAHHNNNVSDFYDDDDDDDVIVDDAINKLSTLTSSAEFYYNSVDKGNNDNFNSIHTLNALNSSLKLDKHNISSSSLSSSSSFRDVHNVQHIPISPTTENVHVSYHRDRPADGEVSEDGGRPVKLPTFFSQMPVSFADLKLTKDSHIPTTTFLDACKSFLHIFDKLNQPAFLPAKLDMSSNIKKIHQKYLNNPEKCSTIQDIVRYEISANQSNNANSATQAILWLTKSLEFVMRLMEKLISRPEEEDIKTIISQVYKNVLMSYHGWVLRSAFSIASSSSPSKKEIIRCLCTDSNQSNKAVLNSLVKDSEDYISGLKSIINLLQSYFQIHNLHIDIDESI